MAELWMMVVSFKWGVAASVVAGALCPLLGVYLIVRRMILLGIALPQVSSAGIALIIMIAQMIKLAGLTPGESPFLSERLATLIAPFGSILAIFGVLIFLAWAEGRSPFTESRWGAVYVISAAALVIFLIVNPYAEAHVATMLEGQVITVTPRQCMILTLSGICIAVAFFLFRKELLLVSFDSEFSASLGVREGYWTAVLYLMMGGAISVGVMILGPMFVFGFMLLPAFAARPWCRGMNSFYLWSAALGGISALAGSIAGLALDWPLGPTEVMAAAVVLLVSRIVFSVRFSIQRARRVPRGVGAPGSPSLAG